MCSDDDIRTCIRVLRNFISDPEAFARLSEAERIELQRVAGLLSRPDRELLKMRNKAIRKEKRRESDKTERLTRAATGIRRAREAAVFSAPRMLAGPETPQDTGWVTDEDPAHLARLKQDVHDFQPPLDIVDGAARVCDPFFDGINSSVHWCGKFLKDYKPIDW